MAKNDYLSHHGVLGQKWGIRRYQNKDGTLTDSGKKHYYKESLRADKNFVKNWNRKSMLLLNLLMHIIKKEIIMLKNMLKQLPKIRQNLIQRHKD